MRWCALCKTDIWSICSQTYHFYFLFNRQIFCTRLGACHCYSSWVCLTMLRCCHGHVRALTAVCFSDVAPDCIENGDTGLNESCRRGVSCLGWHGGSSGQQMSTWWNSILGDTYVGFQERDRPLNVSTLCSLLGKQRFFSFVLWVFLNQINWKRLQHAVGHTIE